MLKQKWKKIAGSLLLAATLFSLSACSTATEPTTETPQETTEAPVEKTEINIAVLKGPTGIGAVQLMEQNDAGTAANDYHVQVVASPDEAMAKLIQGEVDIAALPTNVAAAVYNKSEQEVSVAAINTLGVLHILERGDTIHSIEDLAGQTVYATGQGATPEYVFNYILEKNNLQNVTVNYMAEHAELATAMLSGDVTIGLLPEPNVTAVLLKDSEIRAALDLTEEWNKVETEAQLAMGCIAAKKDFIEQNQEAFDAFLAEYESSVDFVNSDIPAAAALVEQYGIMDSAAAAEQAIPNCNIVFIDGAEMKTALEGFYNILFTANPKSVGGTLPNEDFYYTK